MRSKQEQVLQKLLPMFQAETEERMQTISAGLLGLEKSPNGPEAAALLQSVLREAHSVKGSARAVAMVQVERVCQSFESVLTLLSRRELTATPELFDALHMVVDTVRTLAANPAANQGERARLALERLSSFEVGGSARGVRAAHHKANGGPAALLPAFKAQAEERLSTMGGALADLRDTRRPHQRAACIEALIRDAEILANGAATASLTHVEQLCTSVRQVAEALQHERLSAGPKVLAALEQAAALLKELIGAPAAVAEGRLAHVMATLAALGGSATEAPMAVAGDGGGREAAFSNGAASGAAALATRAAAQTVRVSTDKLDSLFRQAQEMLAIKLTTRQRFNELRDVAVSMDTWRRERSKVDGEIRRLMSWLERRDKRSDRDGLYAPASRVVEFLEWNNAHLRGLEGKLRLLTRAAEVDHQSIGVMVDNLLDDTKRVLMLPFATLLDLFPRMVRDLARSRGKDVNLVMDGGEVEIDKRILEEMKDPLIHLLRNCIDHGIELPDTRLPGGKPAQGTLHIRVDQVAGNQVEIQISDDGAGIDLAAVRSAAVKQGLIGAADAASLSDDDAIPLIFRSGVSTSPTVTNISGRGLGMTIVRERVEKLGGRLTLETQRGRGTTFRIALPLTLSTLRGIVVEVAQQVVVLPTANVERVVRLRAEEIQTVETEETVVLNGQVVSFVRLENVLGLIRKERKDPSGYQLAMVVAAADRRIAFAIDSVLNEQEVLFKSLGDYLASIPNLAGATVLGSGQVVPILSAADLLNTAVGASAGGFAAGVAATIGDEEHKTILIAEDSITSRMLLKEILEAAGYLVTTAVDGADASALLEQQAFDLVVSDVEMPRMNGFELTERIRSDPRLERLPVILVTGLESREHRQRGIDAGASAYIVKSSFDQSNLLDAVQRFV